MLPNKICHMSVTLNYNMFFCRAWLAIELIASAGIEKDDLLVCGSLQGNIDAFCSLLLQLLQDEIA